MARLSNRYTCDKKHNITFKFILFNKIKNTIKKINITIKYLL